MLWVWIEWNVSAMTSSAIDRDCERFKCGCRVIDYLTGKETIFRVKRQRIDVRSFDSIKRFFTKLAKLSTNDQPNWAQRPTIRSSEKKQPVNRFTIDNRLTLWKRFVKWSSPSFSLPQSIHPKSRGFDKKLFTMSFNPLKPKMVTRIHKKSNKSSD